MPAESSLSAEVRWVDGLQAVARSIELSQTRYCGVTASLSAEVTSSYVIEVEGAAE